jgi:hypothetical protein
MPQEYLEITWSIGRTLKDRLRAIEWEPLPKQLSDLLGKVREQDNAEAPRGGLEASYAEIREKLDERDRRLSSARGVRSSIS